MFILLITITISLIIYLCWWYMKKLKYWQNLGIPHEKPHWLMGSLKEARKSKSFAEISLDYYRKFKGTGPFAGFYLSSKPTAFILDLQLIKAILIKDFSNFTDHGFYSNEEDDPLSGRLFQLDGEKWRIMRNCLTPTFTSGKMKLMFPMIQEIGQDFITLMGEKIDETNSVIEIKDLLERFITDIIGTCAFGFECNSLKNPNVPFRRMAKKALHESRHGNLVNAFVMSFPELAKKLHVKQNFDEVEHFYINVVRDTVKYREENNIQRNDFLGMLIDIKNHAIHNRSAERLPELSLEQMAAQAFVFFTAGFETSSTAMGFALYELARNVEVQEKARQEISEVMANHNDIYSYECLQDLKYLQQILSETLRLYTNAPLIGRIAINDYEIPDHPKYAIKKGMNIFIPAAAIHLDEDYYPDPLKFNPDNFSPAAVAQRDSCLFLAFGEGPRNCIGMRFAKMQIIIGLSLLLRNFKFTICDRTEIPLIMDKSIFFINSINGIYLKVSKLEVNKK